MLWKYSWEYTVSFCSCNCTLLQEHDTFYLLFLKVYSHENQNYFKQLNSVFNQNPSTRNMCISGRLWFLRYGVQETIFFFFWILDHFLPFYLYDNLKNQNFEKAKKILGDTHCSCNTTYDRCHFYFSFWIIFCYFTHMCTINDIWWHIWCMVPEIWSVTDRNFGHFGPFFALLPP